MALLSVLAVSVALSSAFLPAYAATKIIAGGGIGHFAGCADNGLPGSISLNVMRTGKTTTGTAITSTAAGQTVFTISLAHITSKSFILEGENGVCGPISFVITGLCGIGVTITFAHEPADTSTPETGAFIGTVTCTK